MDTTSWIYVGFTIFVLGNPRPGPRSLSSQGPCCPTEGSGGMGCNLDDPGAGFRGDSLLLERIRAVSAFRDRLSDRAVALCRQHLRHCDDLRVLQRTRPDTSIAFCSGESLAPLIMRGAFIGMGTFLIQKLNWIMYVFGAFLVFTGIKMAMRQDEEFDAEKNVVMKTARRFLRVTNNYDGQKFFTKEQGLSVATPLFLVLLLVEFTDLVFAVDSIPAIFAVTTDPFLVYTSNVFAILGLRSMYFLLAGVVNKFVYLKYGLSAILTFVGVKMLIVHIVSMSRSLSLWGSLSSRWRARSLHHFCSHQRLRRSLTKGREKQARSSVPFKVRTE